MKKTIAFLMIAIISLSNPSCDKSTNDPNIDIGEEILKVMEKEQIPSVVAAVIKGDEIVWEGTYGYADAAASIPATRQSIYTLMSISKLFIATSVMQLWEKGQIDLEADINDYLPFAVQNPNFPGQKITPYMLLTHTSGLAWPENDAELPGFYHFYSHEQVPLISEWLPELILPDGTNYHVNVWKEFAPGEKWLYSNIGTSLLALIVEEISGEDYRDYCQQHILAPLEMTNTAFRLSHLDESLLSTPFNEQNRPIQQYTYRHYPAGNLKSNLEDFSHFIMAFLNHGVYKGNRILEAATIDKMWDLQNPVSGVALLWWNCLSGCIGHSGGGTGFSTRAEWFFDQDKGMLIFSNRVNSAVYPGGRIYELVRYQCEQF